MNKFYSHQRPAKLFPKEHGAYAMLAIPLVTALIAGGLSFTGICIAITAVAGFFAHEPLLVASGYRGYRIQQSTPQAKRWLFGLLSLACLAGCIAFATGSLQVRVTLAIFMLVSVLSLMFSVAGLHRKTIVHLWGMLGLSLPCLPILLAGDTALGTALSFWAVWLTGFAATTCAVRGMMAKQKHHSRRLHLCSLAFLSGLIATGVFDHTLWLLVTLPMLAVSWYLLLWSPPLKHLNRVGWTMVGGTLSTAVLAVFTFG